MELLRDEEDVEEEEVLLQPVDCQLVEEEDEVDKYCCGAWCC
jgi:hypothetical protein